MIKLLPQPNREEVKRSNGITHSVIHHPTQEELTNKINELVTAYNTLTKGECAHTEKMPNCSSCFGKWWKESTPQEKPPIDVEKKRKGCCGCHPQSYGFNCGCKCHKEDSIVELLDEYARLKVILEKAKYQETANIYKEEMDTIISKLTLSQR